MYDHFEQAVVENELSGAETGGCESFIAISESDLNELRCNEKYWKSLHLRSKERERQLEAQNKALRKDHAPQIALERKVSKLQAELASYDEDFDSSQSDSVQGHRRATKRLQKQLRKSQREVQQLEKRLNQSQKENEELQAENERLKARVARLNRLIFGDKSEKTCKISKKTSADTPSDTPSESEPKRKRSSNGKAKRRDYSHLPVEETTIEVDADRCKCEKCGLPFVLNGYEESELIKIEIQMFRQRIRRERRRSTCQCEGVSKEVVAPVPDRLFVHTRYDVSIWALYAHERFGMQRTVGGFCRFMRSFGVSMSSATLVNRNEDFIRLFSDMFQAMMQRISEAKVIYGDETGWPVQHAGIPGGESYRGWLWMNGTDEVVCMHVDRYRSTDAALVLYGGFESSEPKSVTLVCDRYSVYLKLAKLLDLVLQFCWAHLRRDFINAAVGRVELQAWSEQWLERIGQLYHLNDKRLEHYDSELSLTEQDAAFDPCQRNLEVKVEGFFSTVDSELEGLSPDSAKYQPLNSAATYQAQFSVFVQNPRCRMDNNFSELMLRLGAILRKLTMGSKSEIGAQLTAVMMSIIATLRLNGIREYEWLHDYLSACAANGGKAPEESQSMAAVEDGCAAS